MKNYANAFFGATVGGASSVDQWQTSKCIINDFAATPARTQKTISSRFAPTATPLFTLANGAVISSPSHRIHALRADA
jgi:hypothetical protein